MLSELSGKSYPVRQQDNAGPGHKKTAMTAGQLIRNKIKKGGT
jgi:hypothetical protein